MTAVYFIFLSVGFKGLTALVSGKEDKLGEKQPA